MSGFDFRAERSGVTTSKISFPPFGADRYGVRIALPGACGLLPLSGRLVGSTVVSMNGDDSTAGAGEAESGSTNEPAQVELLVQSPNPRMRAG